MITVAPANTTALPAVASARDIAPPAEPSASWRAMPGQDEQRVVDADGEAQHLGEGRGVLDTVTTWETRITELSVTPHRPGT